MGLVMSISIRSLTVHMENKTYDYAVYISMRTIIIIWNAILLFFCTFAQRSADRAFVSMCNIRLFGTFDYDKEFASELVSGRSCKQDRVCNRGSDPNSRRAPVVQFLHGFATREP